MGAAAGSTNLGHGFPSPGPQGPDGQKVMDHVFFLSEGAWKRAREEGAYDLVVIGTGFCGFAVAQRALERNPHCRILLLERGPFFLPEHFQSLPLPFVGTLGGLSETFPWTLSEKTASGRSGRITWQHGMVPFFGGRSTLWSSWCPRPTEDEMLDWPRPTVEAARAQFDRAEALLHVQNADEIDGGLEATAAALVARRRPVYGALQRTIDARLRKAVEKVDGVYRTQAAPLASDAQFDDGIDFEKFSVPGELLQLVVEAQQRAERGQGAPLHIATNCTVERILNEEGRATGLVTNRGVLALGAAKLILAMGALPPATLVRNSFAQLDNIGERFSAHFISAIVARVPRAGLDPEGAFGDLEIGANYVAGTDGGDFRRQYHIQLTALADQRPDANAERALRYMPDVVATASRAQLETSEEHVVFVCAVLGEIDVDNRSTWFRGNPADSDPTTNSLLQVVESAADRETWDAMDAATFEVLEKVLAPEGAGGVEYWHGAPDGGEWLADKPGPDDIRVPALVHESSTLHIGAREDAPVDLDYRLRGTDNVFVTGGALWPRGGSWNPTLTMVALAMDLTDKLVPSPSTSASPPYLLPSDSEIQVRSLITVPETAGGYEFAGVPDGIGAFASGPDEMTVLVTHELLASKGAARAHGPGGAFVSRWLFDTSEWADTQRLRLVGGSDLIETVHVWDFAKGVHTLGEDERLIRLCSADLAAPSALAYRGLGTQDRIFFGGEETTTRYDSRFGRAFAHIVTGPDAGTSWELPRLGRMSFENVLLSPFSQEKTVAMLPDDATENRTTSDLERRPPSELYVYVGTKTKEGRADERAGLHNGKLYGVRVLVEGNPWLAEDPDDDISGARFELVDLGDRSVAASSPGAKLQKDSVEAGVTRFLRPEDGAWDPRPDHPGKFWFVTTGDPNSRLFHMRFDDITQPERGGTIEIVTSARTHGHGLLDSVTVDAWGRVLVQEDPGGSDKVTSTLMWDGDHLRRVARGDPARFLNANSPSFITRNEEAAGIVPVFDLLGHGWYLAAVQCNDEKWPHHLRPAGSSMSEWKALKARLVTPGQLVAVYIPRDVCSRLSRLDRADDRTWDRPVEPVRGRAT